MLRRLGRDDSLKGHPGIRLIRHQLINMDGIIGAVLLAQLAADAGLDIDFNDWGFMRRSLSIFHPEAVVDRAPVDAIFAAGAGILFDQCLVFGSGRFGGSCFSHRAVT